MFSLVRYCDAIHKFIYIGYHSHHGEHGLIWLQTADRGSALTVDTDMKEWRSELKLIR